MTFQIHPLPKDQFTAYFDMSDDELAQHKAFRVKADSQPGFPCRVSLKDAEIGEDLILLNYTHLDGDTPYAASHAVYVSENAKEETPAVGDVPEVLQRRVLAVRGFDDKKHIIDAEVVDGTVLSATLERLFENPDVQFAQMHFAGRGCFAAQATRA